MARPKRGGGGGRGDVRRERGELAERVIFINRVAKVVKGGRRFSFSALVAVGNENGRVGTGMGKAAEVTEAIRKATENAKKNMVEVPLFGTTVPHPVQAKAGAGKVLIKPASPGTGVIAGGAVRAVLESAGYKDVLTKSLGSQNQYNVVQATMKCLKSLRTARATAARRGMSVRELFQIEGTKQ